MRWDAFLSRNVAAAQNGLRFSSSVRFADSFPTWGSLWNAQTPSLPLEGKVPPKGAKEEEAESF